MVTSRLSFDKPFGSELRAELLRIARRIFLGLILSGLVLATPAYALAATLSLGPSSGTFNRGCNFSLNVELDTAGAQTDGTDAILIYDKTRFNATSITSGTIYDDYPGNSIDSPTPGKITISGLASVSQPFTGKGTLASVNFTALANAPTGASSITFDFDPNDRTKTTDSNVVERGTVADVLTSVVNGNYTVGTGSCGSQTVTGPGVTGPGTIGTGGTGISTGGLPGGQGAVSTPAAAPKALPPAGSEQLTFTLAILGSILTILGILGLAIL